MIEKILFVLAVSLTGGAVFWAGVAFGESRRAPVVHAEDHMETLVCEVEVCASDDIGLMWLSLEQIEEAIQ